jgi:cytochrome b pre-mRNA-processing protein 3
MIFGLFRKDLRREVVQALYARSAEASRAPWLYTVAAIPDTVEGRIEALTLHALLVMRRLKELPSPGPEVAQDYVDALFLHIDHGLRELGVGDTTIPKRMKKIAQGFYGRVQAYAAPIDASDAEMLSAALVRNIPAVAAEPLAAYVLASGRRLSGWSLDDVLTRQDLFVVPVS